MLFNNSLLSRWSAAERSAAEAEHTLITKTSNASGPAAFPCVDEIERTQKLRHEAVGLMHQVLAHLKEVADEIAAQNARAFSTPTVAHSHGHLDEGPNPSDATNTLTVGSGASAGATRLI